MTLSSNSFLALTKQESARLRGSIQARQTLRNRSQYSASTKDSTFNADRGEWELSIPQGGTVYAEAITNSVNTSLGVAVPGLDTRGKADAKPTLS